MESLQKEYLLIFCFLIFANYSLAQQMRNPSSAENYATGSSLFFYQLPDYPRDCQEVYHQCSSSQNASGVYNIKPDGMTEPFEVLCDNTVDSGGWTIQIHRYVTVDGAYLTVTFQEIYQPHRKTVLRRMDGSVDFNRTWAEYRAGFGFVSTEFWIGQERLSYIVNQKKYELRIDIINNEGSSCYMTYHDFRISDGWGDYKLVRLGQYIGTADLCVTLCPTNMEYGSSCSCQATCEDPRNENGCNNVCSEEKTCVCPVGFLIKKGNCVSERDCGCFLEGEGVIKDGGVYINSDCSRRCSCNNNELTCEYLVCNAHATCQETEGSYQCQCNPGFVGDGQDCTAIATDCMELYNAGVTTDGVYTIYPTGWVGSAFEVYCEMESNGGGWTVFQRRVNGSINFYRNWASYKRGFGTLTHEFWLGNDKIHTLSQQRSYQLRIDALNSRGGSVYSLYSSFRISDESEKYRLSVGTESGNTAGNPLHHNNGQPFSTFDRDNDDTGEYNCAEEHKGAWWYNYISYYHHHCCWKWRVGSFHSYCGDSNLNGDYGESGVKSIFFWYSGCNDPNLPECGMTLTEMKLRPV